ncbi:MAG: hypothetical protein SFU86_14070, partial [Pirellulaceae bacterium]|nr:hypothetical protein [Pirellulaceae bacterium]
LDGKRPVYIAGYGMDRKATAVHDPIMARAIVLQSGNERIALAAVDLIGLQHPAVKAIRAKLPGYRYVLVASTHNHQGPDVIGIWGRGPFHRGVDEAYLELVIAKVALAIEQAAASLRPVTAHYGTAEDNSLLDDARLPTVKDGVLRAIRLDQAEKREPAALIVQWNCHPEALGSKNTSLTADFTAATVAALREKYRCPVLYLSGAVGGLMAPPEERIKDASGQVLATGNFDYCRRYGEEVALLAGKSIDAATPLELTPFTVSSARIAVPVQNALYRMARALGVVKRESHVWTGNFLDFGTPMTLDTRDLPTAVETEVACLRLGELFVPCLPGELYPELVYGKFPEPADPRADFPDVPLEPTISTLMPGPKWLFVGLANDELGYIIPKRQWDRAAPYCFGLEMAQYGEINSCGPEVAPILMQALKLRMEDLAATK